MNRRRDAGSLPVAEVLSGALSNTTRRDPQRWPWCWAPSEVADSDEATWWALRRESCDRGWDPPRPLQGREEWVARMRASRARDAGLLAQLEALRDANHMLREADGLRQLAADLRQQAGGTA